MKPVLNTLICVFLLFFLSSMYHERDVYAQDDESEFSLVFGWKTGGSHELLTKKATALKELKGDNGISISFGHLLGQQRIVQFDGGIQYLKSARQAGFDYVIPAASEFMLGVETFKKFAMLDDAPRFISANIVVEKTRRTLVDPYAVWDVNGQRICIIAMSDNTIIKESKDENVAGIDIISIDQALTAVAIDIVRENADMVIVAGRIDRETVTELSIKHPFVDVFVTNFQSGGFTDKKSSVTTSFISGKPVYIVSEKPDHLGQLTFKDMDGVESRELTDVIIGNEFPPEETVAAELNAVLEELKQKDYEESVTMRAGNEVASVLREVFDADVVLLERQSLYYFPLEDTLSILNFRKIVKPTEKIVSYSLKGSLLKSIREQSASQTDPALCLHFGGMTVDGKVDSIPIQDERDYNILTTTFLRKGGNGYELFTQGTGEILTDVNMLKVVERFLVDKDRRIRKALKKKNWTAAVGLNISSNFIRDDVDKDKSLYSGIPNPFRDQSDAFDGILTFSSTGNRFKYRKNRSELSIQIRAVYERKGHRTVKDDILYRKGNDYLRIYNQYNYLINFVVNPYLKIDFATILYSISRGKHPLTATIGSGFTRSFPSLWGLRVNAGIKGERNYKFLDNTFGTDYSFGFNKSFEVKSRLPSLKSFNFLTKISWDPMAKYHMAFYLENYNSLVIQIWKRYSINIDINCYSYRNTQHRKVAIGFHYKATFGYNLSKNF